ncbi:UNVERIFIED_CONTAM: hypothetical protein PYX00_003697 [Menopon gallinae]|uniref:Uncharacterized protein n=1 Tax=Menopon gallinae TaxID=328185 RepID=A0AAW2I3I3_9NEOP
MSFWTWKLPESSAIALQCSEEALARGREGGRRHRPPFIKGNWITLSGKFGPLATDTFPQISSPNKE